MARNKHPEETVGRILDVASRLFLEKGYEHTSIQDIINNLGGLSKGAIYHHFKSKEEILIAVTDRMTAESNHMLAQIRDASGLNGREKLRWIFKASINRPVQNDIFSVAPDFRNNPRLLDSLLRESVEDGSIQTEYPEQLAELIMLAANIWMNPMVFDSSPQESLGKFMVFRQMMSGLGVDIVDEEMIRRLAELTDIYNRRK